MVAPLPGWIQYSELAAPVVKVEENSKGEEPKEIVIDLTSESTQTVSKNATDDETSKAEGEKAKTIQVDSDKGSGEDSKVNGATNGKNIKKIAEEILNGATKTAMDVDDVDGSTEVVETEDPPKDEYIDNKTVEDETVEADATDSEGKKGKEIKASDIVQKKAVSSSGKKEVIDISVDSCEDEICTDDDWEWFEDPEEETIAGNWSCGQKGGCFTLEQLEDGVIDGYLENKETCSIEGKIEGDRVWFNQNWQKGSVHGVGVVTVVKGTWSDRMRVMNLEFEATSK